MSRILVTGASGFVGKPCVSSLLEHGFEVHGVCRNPVEDSPDVVWHRANLLDPSTPKSLVSKIKPTHLLHLAWNAVPGIYWGTSENLDWVAASLSLLKEFAESGGERAVGVGTCAEYLWDGSTCVENKTPLAPATLYGHCKAATGNMFLSYAKEVGISVAWARLFHLFGPDENPLRLVPSICRGLLSKTTVRLTDGLQLRDFMEIEKCAAALVSLLMTEVEGPINIATGMQVQLRELALILGKLAGVPDLLEFGAVPRSGNDPDILAADIYRLKNEVGFDLYFNLEKLLARTFDFWSRAEAN